MVLTSYPMLMFRHMAFRSLDFASASSSSSDSDEPVKIRLSQLLLLDLVDFDEESLALRLDLVLVVFRDGVERTDSVRLRRLEPVLLLVSTGASSSFFDECFREKRRFSFFSMLDEWLRDE